MLRWFTVLLPETLCMPENAVVYVDDVCIPYSWYTITDNFNDKIYVWVNGTFAHSFVYYIFKIDQGVYSSYTLTENSVSLSSNKTCYFYSDLF